MDNKEWKIIGAMSQILSIPFYKGATSENSAILILPGRYQEYRITEGVKLWPFKAKHLWVAGTYGDPFYTREEIISYCGKDSENIIVAGKALHTRDQMDWACRLLANRFSEVEHLIITTAVYHLPRCILAFLQAMKETKKTIIVSPIPLLNPNGISFSLEDFKSEVEKIKKYEAEGYILSIKRLDPYIQQRLSQ